MNLDIRLPIGLLFLITGLLLAGYGLVTRNDAALYKASLGYNINLWWGLAMLAFGAVMTALGRRKPAPVATATSEVPPVARH